MVVPPGVWPFLGLLWLLAALSVHGRGDAFQAEEMPENDLSLTTSPLDDILDINQVQFKGCSVHMLMGCEILHMPELLEISHKPKGRSGKVLDCTLKFKVPVCSELILLEEPESSFLIEGDVVRVSPFGMFPFAKARWPKKEGIVQVPFIISYKYDKSSVKKIQEAFQDFEKFTCIKFVPHSSQRDFIFITPLPGGFSSVGRTGGMQVVSLAAACLRKGKVVALHELMHVLGFWHEHSRADRDKYISIAWDEILTGFETSFMKSWTTNMLVDYDYSSVMHYGRNAFSMRGLPTIVPLSRSCPVIGQSWNLSNSDIARVNKLYRCSQVAAQPTVTTEQVIEVTMADFVPSELGPYSPRSKVGILTAWSPSPVASATQVAHAARESLQQVDATLPFSPAVEEGFPAIEVHSRGTAAPRIEVYDWHMASQETSSKTEVNGKHPMVSEGMLHSTQHTEIAMKSTAQKASVSQALQNVTSSANQPLHYEEDYTPRRQNATEKMRPAALTTSSPLTSPAPLTADTARGTAGRPSKSLLQQLLSGTGSVHGERMEPPTSIAVGSNDTEDNGFLSPAEGLSFSTMENATKELEELFHTTVSEAGGKAGDSASTHLKGVWAEAVSYPYITLSPRGLRNPTMATNIGGPFSTAGSQALIATGMVDTDVERLSEKSEAEMTYTLSTSGRASAVSENVLWATSEEALENSGSDLDQSRPTARAQSPWDTITGYLAATSRLKEVMESSPEDFSKAVEQSSMPPAHLAREGEGEVFTLLSQGSVLPTEQIRSEKWASVHVVLPTQAPTLREEASLATETKQVAHPTEGSPLAGVSWSQSPPPTELRHMVSWGQPSSTKGYRFSTLPRQTTSAGVHRGEVSQSALEVVSLATTKRPSLGQEASLGLGPQEEPEGQVHAGTELPEDTKMDVRASLWSVLPTASLETQISPRPGCGLAETQRQQPSSLSVGTRATGASNIDLQTENLAGVRTAVSALSWSREMTGLPYMAQTTKRLPAPSGSQWKLMVTEDSSQGAEAKGLGSILSATEKVSPPSETNPSPSWVSHSGNLREDNGTESLEDTSSAARGESSKLLKVTPERATASNGRTAAMTYVGATALALGVEKAPSSPPVAWTESPAHSGSPLGPFWDWTTARSDYSKPEKVRPLAGGRLAESANATKEAAWEGMDWATTQALKARLEQRGFASPLLEVGSPALKSPAATEGMARPHTTGSLESPEFAFHSEGLAAGHPPGEISPPTGVPVDIATALQAYAASTAPLGVLENQTTAATDARAVMSVVSKRSREFSMETAMTGTAPLIKIPWLTSLGAPIVEHTATKPIKVESLQLQTKMARLEGPAWSTSEMRGKAKVMKFLFQKGTSPVMENGVQISRDTAATEARLGSKRLVVNSTGIPEAANTGVAPLLSRYTKGWGESTATSGKKGITSSSIGPTSKPTLETIGNLSSGNGRTSEMAPSVPGAENSLGSKKMLPSELSLENRNPIPVEPTEGASASTVGSSSVYPQTPGLAETGTPAAADQAHAIQGPLGYSKLLGKRTAREMGSGKRLPSTEASETQTLVRFNEKTKSLTTEELQQNGRPSMDSHNIHWISKRSLPEAMPTPSPASVSPKERHHECQPLRWQTRHLKSRKLEVVGSEKATHVLGKRGLGGPHQVPLGSASGCIAQIHLSKSVSPKEVLAVKSIAKRMAPTRGSNVHSARPRRWLFPVRMAGGAQLVPPNTVKPAQSLTFCCFERDLCGWERSKEEDLDWVLKKEQEQPAELVDGGIPSRTSYRISDGRISPKPSVTKVPSQKAILISPVMHVTGCLKFFYSPMGSTVGKISIYRKLQNSSEWHQVGSAKWDRDMGWYPMALPLARTYKLQVILEGVDGHKMGSLAGTDILVCRRQCADVLCEPNKL